MIRVLFMIAVLMLTLAGCKANHQQDVDAYRSILDEGTPEPELAPDGTLSLYTALAMANRSSESLAINGEAFARSILDRRRTVAAFYPSVDFAPRYSVRDRQGGGGVDADLDLSITADLTVFNGLQNVNSYWRDVYLVERQRSLLQRVWETSINGGLTWTTVTN